MNPNNIDDWCEYLKNVESQIIYESNNLMLMIVKYHNWKNKRFTNNILFERINFIDSDTTIFNAENRFNIRCEYLYLKNVWIINNLQTE
jgi:hypothetical protein